ncbi:hypothetical protein U1Q18_002971 [Sarracenia purpurea var. burkii]
MPNVVSNVLHGGVVLSADVVSVMSGIVPSTIALPSTTIATTSNTDSSNVSNISSSLHLHPMITRSRDKSKNKEPGCGITEFDSDGLRIPH